MSRLIEKLKKVGDAGPARMGFGPASRQESAPSILLIGRLSASALKKGQSLKKAPVDAVIISYNKGDGPLSEAKEALDAILWGLWPASGSCTQAVDELKSNGGDFIIFSPEYAPAEILQEEQLGKILALGAVVDEDTARGLDALAVDAVVLKAPEGLIPLTVQKLIEIEASRCLVGKNVLMEVSSALGSKDLIAIRDLAVDGLIVDLENAKASELKDMRAAIDGLPKKKAKSEKMGAMLPRTGLGFGAAQPRKEEEEEGEEE